MAWLLGMCHSLKGLREALGRSFLTATQLLSSHTPSTHPPLPKLSQLSPLGLPSLPGFQALGRLSPIEFLKLGLPTTPSSLPFAEPSPTRDEAVHLGSSLWYHFYSLRPLKTPWEGA